MSDEKNFEADEAFEESNNDGNKKEDNRLKRLLIFIIVFAVVFSAVYFGSKFYYSHKSEPVSTTTAVATQPSSTDVPLAENPIDFETFIAGNDEIYAFIQIEDTNVSYPIVQSAVDDEFYLRHSGEDKSYLPQGAIYTESCNHKDFSDPFTLIYGHNNYGDKMFTTLHYFEDEEFFDSHPYFYIYMPKRKLTYQVVSAFKYDDRHIMNMYSNFKAEEDVDEFQQVVTNPESSVKNVRTNLDVSVDRSSKFVILSTCITNQTSSRYLVCGVLTNDEKTY